MCKGTYRKNVTNAGAMDTTNTYHLLYTKYNNILIRLQLDLPQIPTVEPCTTAET
jgi:hypothetical protein